MSTNNKNNKLFIENYNNQNQYNKNNLVFIGGIKENNKQYKININKEFSIIKIKESIINDYFKFNLFLDRITIDDFKEIKNKFENNQLLYNRILVNEVNGIRNSSDPEATLFKIHELISYENSEIVSNLFKILELRVIFKTIPPNSKNMKSNNITLKEIRIKTRIKIKDDEYSRIK
ncbi:hypothetical protein ACTFIW_011007 [Dictyostelium discoideum]